MKRLTLIILGVLLCTPLYSDMNPYIAGVPVSGGCTENCGDFLVCQNFEGTGYDNSETWTENGTVNEDYTTTILRGSQSCQITTTGYIESVNFTGQSTLYMHWLYRKASNPGSENRLFTISGSAGYLAQGHLQTDGTIRLNVGNGTDVYTSDELSNDTTYHIWVAYTAGTAGNGSASLYAGTGLTRPASPLATATNAAAVGDAVQLHIRSGGVTATVDQILVDGSSFSEVCE